MVWTDEKDELLLREILLFEPFQYKPRTKERGNAWKSIADNLNKLDGALFKVDQRAVRERFGTLRTRFESKNRDELKASGIAPEDDLIMDTVEEIVEKIKEFESKHTEEEQSQNNKNEKEVQAASDMRQQALETFCQSRKRNADADSDSECDEKRKKKKARSSGSDTLNYLREKGERDEQLKHEQLEVKKRKYDLLEAQQRANEAQQQENINLMREQFALQQQQTNQMLLLMAQMLQNKQ